MTPSERALSAERLLSEPLIKEAFRAVEQRLVDVLKGSPIGDVDTHHNIALSLQLLGQIERQFRNWVAEGQLEQSRSSSLKPAWLNKLTQL
jgi:hypothetical protein